MDLKLKNIKTRKKYFREKNFIKKLQWLQFYYVFLSLSTFPSDGRELQKTIFNSNDNSKGSRIIN